MKLYPNQLSASIQKQPLPQLFMVFGDEPLQQLESIDLIRSHLQSQGADERISLTISPQLDWHDFAQHFQAMSLFSSRKIIELEMPTGKLDKTAQATLKDVLEIDQQDVTLVLYGPKLGADQQRLAWYKKLAEKAWVIQCYPLEGQRLNQWIQQRCQQHQLRLDRQGQQLLADFCEGNLLAARQEIEKLSLIHQQQPVTLEQLRESIINQSRFNVFQLVDAVLANQVDKALKITLGMLEEGTDATVILWALQREWLLLKQLQHGLADGQNLAQLFKQHRIWQNRQGLLNQAIGQHSLDDINQILAELSDLDMNIKSQTSLNLAQQIVHMLIKMMYTNSLASINLKDYRLA